MEWLNYHHLLYFWTVARAGSITAAGAQLQLASPTISAQVAALERSLGEKLLTRAGRRLTLTDAGRVAFAYADQIFGLGRELLSAVRRPTSDRPLTLVVGIADDVPKLIVYRLLEPALRIDTPVRIVCREGPPHRLLAELAVHGVDVVLSDAPAGAGVKVRVFHHVLGECGVSFFAAPRLAAACVRRFPGSLTGAPLLVPRDGSPLRGGLERWLEDQGIRPKIVGEFDDSALMQAFGAAGTGVFAVPSMIENQVRRQHRVQVIGRTEEVRERFYAIGVDRKLTHPAVAALGAAARDTLFAAMPSSGDARRFRGE